METPHIAADSLKAFLLGKAKLSEEEHDHLAKCEECMRSMVEAAIKELRASQEPN